MPTFFDTPAKLQDALRKGETVARDEFERWCSPLMQCLAESASKRFKLKTPFDPLKQELVRWAALYLRSIQIEELPRDFSGLQGIIIPAVNMALLSVGSPAPQGELDLASEGRESNWKCGSIQLQSCSLGLGSVTGDRLMDGGTDDDRWLLLADVTGFGHAVRDVVVEVEHFWNKPELVQLRQNPDQTPKQLLDAIAEEVGSLRSRKVFIDAMIFRGSNSKNELLIAAAGVARFVKYSRKNARLRVEYLCGSSLGWGSSDWSTRTVPMESGDEFLFATAKLFDHQMSRIRLCQYILDLPAKRVRSVGLMTSVRHAFQESGIEQPQTNNFVLLSATLPCECGQESFDCLSLVEQRLGGGSAALKQDAATQLEQHLRSRMNQAAKPVLKPQIYKNRNGLDKETLEMALKDAVDVATQKTWTSVLGTPEKGKNKGVPRLRTWRDKEEEDRPPFCYWLCNRVKFAAKDRTGNAVLSKPKKKAKKPQIWHDADSGYWMGRLGTGKKYGDIPLVSGAADDKKAQAEALRLLTELKDREIGRPMRPDKECDERFDDDWEELEHGVALQPEILQRVFQLHHVEKRGSKECAAILGCDPKTFFNRKKELHNRLVKWAEQRRQNSILDVEI